MPAILKQKRTDGPEKIYFSYKKLRLVKKFDKKIQKKLKEMRKIQSTVISNV